MKALFINSKDASNAHILSCIKDLSDKDNVISLSDVPDLEESYFKQLDKDAITHIFLWGKVDSYDFSYTAKQFADAGFSTYVIVNAMKFSTPFKGGMDISINSYMTNMIYDGIQIAMAEEVPIVMTKIEEESILET